MRLGDVRPVAWHANGATRQALTARAMLVLVDRGPGSVGDRAAARRTGTGRSAPDEPIVVAVFFLGAMVMKKR